jgi:hypothetical protein
MVSPAIQIIRSIADEFRDDERNLTLYFPDLETPPEPGSLNRVFGPPVGLTELQWPVYPRLGELLAEANALHQWAPDDLRMEHVFTVDLKGIRLLGAPEEARAMLLFLSNATLHRAMHRGNGDTAVLFLREDEVARGLYRGPLPDRSLRRWSRRFTLQRVDVPGDVFDPHEDETSPLARLHDAIWQAPARLGGCPIWVRDPCELDPSDSSTTHVRPIIRQQVGLPGSDAFVMQLDRRFAEINLGRHGVLYVSGAGAYAQSFDQ